VKFRYADATPTTLLSATPWVLAITNQMSFLPPHTIHGTGILLHLHEMASFYDAGKYTSPIPKEKKTTHPKRISRADWV